MSVPEASHIKKICQALQRRGSTLTNDDALKLLAYQPDVHERASERFKKSHGKIKDPLAYYLFICREIINQDGRRADWNRVEKLREEGYVLLEETLIGTPTGTSYVKNPDSQKGTIGGPSYTEQVQQERKKMAEESKKWENSGMTLAEKIMYWNNVLVETQRKADEGDQIAKNGIPFAKMILQGFMDSYVVNPDNEKAIATARSFSIPVSSTSDFKTPASCLSSILPSPPIVKKSEPVTLKEDIWEGFKDYDSDEPKEEYYEETYD